jgi:Flp pilus assembly protein TadG
MRTLKGNRKMEKGAELVEFALVLPLLLVLCLGVIEFGRAYYTYNLLTKAVRDGARFGATSQVSSAGVLTNAAITSTKNVVVYGNAAGTGTKKVSDLLTSQVFVDQQLLNAGDPTVQYTTVRVVYPYVPLFGLVMPATINFRPSVKMHFIGSIIF